MIGLLLRRKLNCRHRGLSLAFVTLKELTGNKLLTDHGGNGLSEVTQQTHHKSLQPHKSELWIVLKHTCCVPTDELAPEHRRLPPLLPSRPSSALHGWGDSSAFFVTIMPHDSEGCRSTWLGVTGIQWKLVYLVLLECTPMSKFEHSQQSIRNARRLAATVERLAATVERPLTNPQAQLRWCFTDAYPEGEERAPRQVNLVALCTNYWL